MDEWWPLIAAVIAVLLVACYQLAKLYNRFDEHGIPTNKGLPLIGSTWRALCMRQHFADVVVDVYNIHPESKYVAFFELMTPIVSIRDIDLIKTITVKAFEHFPDHRTIMNDENEPLFAKNLFALRGERWKEMRNMLTPAFTSSKMKSMFVLMRECAKQYGDYLVSLPECERQMELKDTFTRYTNDVIATCAFGITVDSMRDRKNKFYTYGREATSFGRWQTIRFLIIRSMPWLAHLFKVKIVKQHIADFFMDLVATTIRTRDERGIVRPDMIQLMMESRGKLGPGKELTIEEMTAQAFVFFFGGFESASTLMCFAAYEVGIHEDVQRRLQDEIDQVLEDCNGNVTYEAINNMRYLDAIINESLRMYPVVVAVDRVCAKSYELPPALPGLKPYVVEKGDCLWIPIYAIQHDPKHFPDPHTFNPDRFYDDPKQAANAGTFLTFGLGPRMCIGNRFAILEAKVLLFHLFAKCNLVASAKTPIPMVLSKKGFTMTAENGFWFDVQPRSKDRRVLVNSVSNGGVVC